MSAVGCFLSRATVVLLLCLQCLSVSAQTIVEYVHTDTLGSVVAITDASGQLVGQRRTYEPYGSQIEPSMQDGPGYTGHVQDAGTGLVYMQQRYYDPRIGRFLSVDPVAADSNSGGNFNRYWYANNNPYKFTDPDGRYVESALDVAFIVADGVDIAQNGLNLTNGLSMAANIVGLAVPFGTGFGPAVRGISAGVDAAKSEIKASDRVSGVAIGVGREADRAALRNAGVPTSRSRADVKQPGGMPVPKAQRQQMATDSNNNPVVVSRHGPHPNGNQPHDKHPHSHAATPKIEQQEISRHKDGTVRYHN